MAQSRDTLNFSPIFEKSQQLFLFRRNTFESEVSFFFFLFRRQTLHVGSLFSYCTTLAQNHTYKKEKKRNTAAFFFLLSFHLLFPPVDQATHKQNDEQKNKGQNTRTGKRKPMPNDALHGTTYLFLTRPDVWPCSCFKCAYWFPPFVLFTKTNMTIFITKTIN